MHLIGLDFESYYDSDYSLFNMPTHQYVRDERFQCLGCGFQFEHTGQPFYVSDVGKVREILDLIPWDDTILVAHNAQFDGTVLWERFGQKSPAFWFDTQLMARWAVAQGHLDPWQRVSLAKLAPLVGMVKGDTRAAVDAGGQQLADYGTEDVRIMMALLKRFLAMGIPREELAYMDMHVRMATEPVLRIDRPLLEEAATQSPDQARLHKLLRKDANFRQVLEAKGIEVEYKTTPKGKRKPAFAKTDAFMQSLLNHDDVDIAQLAELRLWAQSNIVRTRAQRLLDVGEPLPVPLLYYAAHTGRSGGQDKLNPQNLPSKGPLRQAIMAPEGCSLVVGDSRQVEARTIGWRAGDENLLNTFQASDPYSSFAAEYIFQKCVGEVEAWERKIGKAAVLGLGFRQRAKGFQAALARQGIHVDLSLAEAAVQAYDTAFPMVEPWTRQIMHMVQEGKGVTLPSGRRITYPNLHWGIDEESGRRQLYFDRHLIFSKARKGQRQRVKLWHGLLAENDTQATARDVVFWQIWQFAEEGKPAWRAGAGTGSCADAATGGWKVVWMTHDEAVAVARDEDAEHCAERLLYWLRQVPDWAEGLPVDGEVSIAKRYGEAK